MLSPVPVSYTHLDVYKRQPLRKVVFTLYGSFAKTYRGHGTDQALLGGILGFNTDDRRIPDSFRIASERGLEYQFIPNEATEVSHPNTVDISMTNAAGQTMTVRGESLGGGKIRILSLIHISRPIRGHFLFPGSSASFCCVLFLLFSVIFLIPPLRLSLPPLPESFPSQ